VVVLYRNIATQMNTIKIDVDTDIYSVRHSDKSVDKVESGTYSIDVEYNDDDLLDDDDDVEAFFNNTRLVKIDIDTYITENKFNKLIESALHKLIYFESYPHLYLPKDTKITDNVKKWMLGKALRRSISDNKFVFQYRLSSNKSTKITDLQLRNDEAPIMFNHDPSTNTINECVIDYLSQKYGLVKRNTLKRELKWDNDGVKLADLIEWFNTKKINYIIFDAYLYIRRYSIKIIENTKQLYFWSFMIISMKWMICLSTYNISVKMTH
jgi:hypothetical protein